MRIYNREDFLKLGVVLFCKSEENSFIFGNLCVKGSTYLDDNGNGIDFVFVNLCDIEAFDSDELFAKYDEMLRNGTSEKIRSSGERDGCFDDKDRFLVYEKNDILEICNTILKFM